MADPTLVLGKPLPPVAWLVIRSGKQAGRDYRLGTETTIGRDATSCDFILDDDSISAEHSRVKEEQGQFVLYDLGSTNGTYLNGSRIQRSALIDGDVILVGDTKLVFKEVRSTEG